VEVGVLLGGEESRVLGETLRRFVGISLGVRLGLELGSVEGILLGATFGNWDGVELDRRLGSTKGGEVGKELGDSLGWVAGTWLGNLLGFKLGATLGNELGGVFGAQDGEKVGILLGGPDGYNVDGETVGRLVTGLCVGMVVGPRIGITDIGAVVEGAAEMGPSGVGTAIIGAIIGATEMGANVDGATVGRPVTAFCVGVVVELLTGTSDTGAVAEGAVEMGPSGVGTVITAATIGAMEIGANVDGAIADRSMTAFCVGAVVGLLTGTTEIGAVVEGVADICPSGVGIVIVGAIIGAMETGANVDGETFGRSVTGLCVGMFVGPQIGAKEKRAVLDGDKVGGSATGTTVGSDVGHLIGAIATGDNVDGETEKGSERGLGTGAGEKNIGAGLKGAAETGILAVSGVEVTGVLVDDVLTGRTLGDSVDVWGSSSMMMETTFTTSPALSYVKLSTNPQSAVSKSSMLAIKSLAFTTVTLVLKSEQNTSVVRLLTLYCALTDMSDSCARIKAVRAREDTLSLSVSIAKNGSVSGQPSQ
jgi:hypothetical protein